MSYIENVLPDWRKRLQISRPRFWIYVFGPYIVGLLIGARHLEELRSWMVFVFGLFFLLPANLLIYGVNDIFDYETDRINPKKSGYEAPVAPHESRALVRFILLLCVPFAVCLLWTSARAIAAMMGFLFFSIFYSAPPIRAKTKPILDAAFNMLYIFPGIFAYCLLGGHNISIAPVLAASLWAMAMHAYSAVPDISSDKSVGLNTVATLLGFRRTLWACLIFYAASAWLSYQFLGLTSLALGAVYITMMLLSLRTRSEEQLLRVYKTFPLLNTLSGAALFFTILRLKFL